MTAPTAPERLVDHLPPAGSGAPEADVLLERFVEWAEGEGFALYPAQEEALLEVVSGSNVILSTPTGSGKSLVAAGAHFAALGRDQVSFYTAPIKALVSEKFFALVDLFGADNVGLMTGDATVNGDAPIIACTAEILANLALREGAEADVGVVIMDEFHFYAEPDRGWAWQVPLLGLPQAQFLLMSATLGDVTHIADDLTKRTDRPTAEVTSTERPIPLEYRYVTTAVHETIEELLASRKAPIYVVHFTQAAAVERAQALTSMKLCTPEEKEAIAETIGGFRFAAGFGKTLTRYLRHGIGVHHAGMLPKYRRLVEQLSQAGLLKVICGTDTLGVGINVPIRTVVFTALAKYDGEKTRHLKAREFHQIAGRAGRAGYDTAGTVVVQAPEHVVENEKAKAKAAEDPKKKKKLKQKSPPDGFVNWAKGTFDRLVEAEPETLTSSMHVSHAMLINVMARPGDAVAALEQLLTDNHEDHEAQQAHLAQAMAMFDELVAAGVIERLDEPDAEGRTVRLTVDLQPNFALNQPLSPFAVTALDLLDTEAPTHALDVLSVIESTLEDPRQVLGAQRYKAKGEAVAAMKAQGIEYDERMDLLEEVTHPKPLADLLYAGFDIYRESHPWIADYNVSPKSVAREMYEQAMTFADYVGFYNLARSEGILLRYLADAYKALRSTVPDEVKTEEIDDIEAWLGEVVRQTDSSLLDEWEALRNPDAVPTGAPPVDEAPPPVTANTRAFRVLVRNALFRRVELAARRRWSELGDLDGAGGWTAGDWEEALAPYFETHGEVGTGANARGPHLLVIDELPGRWQVRQVIDDPAGDHDWAITADVDLAASDEAGEAVVRVTGVGSG
jgi:superfamily II RNA helicase